MMKVTVKAGGMFTKQLPASRSGNVAEMELDEGSTPADVLRAMDLPADGSYLIVHNGESVPKSERASRRLAEGDMLAVMPPLRGG
jgi:sulfur carrier protein ThiS